VIVFHVLDPAEIEFTFARPTLFQGLEQMPQVIADPRSLRRAYLREFETYLRAIRLGCRRHALDYQEMRTDRPLDWALSSYLTARAARMRE
jgi:hypothetical protein